MHTLAGNNLLIVTVFFWSLQVSFSYDLISLDHFQVLFSYDQKVSFIHILVGFYLPTTFLSSLFQQVYTQPFQTFTPSQPFNGCIIQVCISCTISNWITSHKSNTSQRFHRFHNMYTHSWDLISLQPFFHWLFRRIYVHNHQSF